MRLREVKGRAEILLPVSITDKNDWCRAFFVVVRGEIPAKDWLNAEDFEKAGCDGCNHGARWLRSARNGHGEGRVLCDCLEAVILIPKVVEVRICQVGPRAMVVDFEDSHDAVRFAKGQGAKEDAVDHAKNGRGCADAEGKSKNRDGAEARRLAQHAESKAQVLKQGFEEGKAASFTVLLFGLLRTAEAKQGLAAGFRGRKAAAEIFLDGEF